MFYIFEPQRNVSESPDETQFWPCAIADAEVFAVFTREQRESIAPDEDAEYLGDIPASAFLAFVREHIPEHIPAAVPVAANEA